jgi:hypothetical protein
MPNLLQRGSDWLADQFKLHATVDVVYEQAAEQVAVKATIGRTVFELDNGHGVLERTESRDFLILGADLVLGGSPALPQRGDRVRETQGVKVYVYEVMAPGREPAWRWSDPYRKLLRIHTKQIAVENA